MQHAYHSALYHTFFNLSSDWLFSQVKRFITSPWSNIRNFSDYRLTSTESYFLQYCESAMHRSIKRNDNVAKTKFMKVITYQFKIPSIFPVCSAGSVSFFPLHVCDWNVIGWHPHLLARGELTTGTRYQTPSKETRGTRECGVQAINGKHKTQAIGDTPSTN